MYRIRFLADRFTTQNTTALLYPLLRFTKEIEDGRMDVKVIFNESQIDGPLDFLVVFDKYLESTKRYGSPKETLERLKGKAEAIVYFDTGDSSGLLQEEPLQVCHYYFKPFLLSERRLYGEAHYGGRLFTDYYHREHSVVDQEPVWSTAVTEQELLSKLRVSWSPAFFPYDRYANRAAKAYRHARFPFLLKWKRRYASPNVPRPLNASCRMSLGHRRNTVAYQRKILAARLSGIVDTGFISRQGYEREMRAAKAVISPFGWGEYALRDYEAMVNGSALIKPDMDHIETWPNIYRKNETYVPLDWDLGNLTAVLEGLDERAEEFRSVAWNGQNLLRSVQRDGEVFARHLSDAFQPS